MKEQLEKLKELKGYIETETFQQNIMSPLYKELEKIKNAYDCESLRELATMKGKKQGLMWLIKRLKDIEQEGKNLITDLESQQE